MFPKGILPEDLMQSAFIAGGYAACPALASDLDLWVKVADSLHSESDAEDCLAEGSILRLGRQVILDHLEAEFFPYEVQDTDITSTGQNADGYPISVLKVAIVRSPHLSHPIHIMVFAGSIEELLACFDISTHQIALSFGGVVKGPHWTPVTERPYVIPGSTSVQTPARLEKIAQRFSHSLSPQSTR